MPNSGGWQQGEAVCGNRGHYSGAWRPRGTRNKEWSGKERATGARGAATKGTTVVKGEMTTRGMIATNGPTVNGHMCDANKWHR